MREFAPALVGSIFAAIGSLIAFVIVAALPLPEHLWGIVLLASMGVGGLGLGLWAGLAAKRRLNGPQGK